MIRPTDDQIELMIRSINELGQLMIISTDDLID